jgi:hypothetical protein
MKRQLSGYLTIPVKIIIPALWILNWGAIVLMLLIGVDERTRTPPILFFVFGGVVTVILYFAAVKYMKVGVDEKSLYVSNYLKEISIPLSDIADVTESLWARGHPVTVYLKTTSPFGKKISFLPKSQGFKFLKSHPVVAELKQMAKINDE